MKMRIGELAARAACDVQTIRYYEREGLLEPPEREPSGYRRYAGGHLARLHFIRHCRTLDIPLAEVRRCKRSCAIIDAFMNAPSGHSCACHQL
jgi:DNA-binding transcriptional MerR regulator